MNRNVELAARALCLAAGKDPDACAKTEEREVETGPYYSRRKQTVCTAREWESHTREARAVLMAVGLDIFDPAPAPPVFLGESA